MNSYDPAGTPDSLVPCLVLQKNCQNILLDQVFKHRIVRCLPNQIFCPVPKIRLTFQQSGAVQCDFGEKNQDCSGHYVKTAPDSLVYQQGHEQLVELL